MFGGIKKMWRTVLGELYWMYVYVQYVLQFMDFEKCLEILQH